MAMTICRRCGAAFDYNKWDGVCPKCCMYNRPDGSREEDNCWMDNYNIDDNSYRGTFDHTHTASTKTSGRNSAYNRANAPTDRVNVQRRDTAKYNRQMTQQNSPVNQPRQANSRQKSQIKKPKIILICVIIYIIFTVVIPFISSLF